jgi:hypothetical protein
LREGGYLDSEMPIGWTPSPGFSTHLHLFEFNLISSLKKKMKGSAFSCPTRCIYFNFQGFNVLPMLKFSYSKHIVIFKYSCQVTCLPKNVNVFIECGLPASWEWIFFLVYTLILIYFLFSFFLTQTASKKNLSFDPVLKIAK